MSEEAIDPMPEGAGGTQVPAQIDTNTEATKPAATSSQTTPADLRRQMFGSKTSRKPAEVAAAAEQPKPAEAVAAAAEQPKPAEAVAAAAEQPKPATGKTARDRVMELAREKNEWKSKAETSSKEIDRLNDELTQLKMIKDEEKTAKEQVREMFIEEKLRQHNMEIVTELHDYLGSREDPEVFKANYEYYMPIMEKTDPWTVNQIAKYPERLKMLDMFFETMNNGVFTQEQWANAAPPVKMRQILALRDIVRNPPGTPPKTPAAGVEEPKAKDIPDSVVPNLNPKHDPSKPTAKGSTFYKVFNKGFK